MSLQTPNRLHAAMTVLIGFDDPDITVQITGSANIIVDELAQLEIDSEIFSAPMVQPIIPQEAMVMANADGDPIPCWVSPLPPGQDPNPALLTMPPSSLAFGIQNGFPGISLTIQCFQVESEPGAVVVSPF